MRNILDQVMKSRDPLADPHQAKLIEDELENRSKALQNVQKENEELCEIIKEKQNTIQEQASTIQEKDKRIEKIKLLLKEKNKSLFSHREKSRELTKVRNELLLLKSKTTGKGKVEVEQIMKSQQEAQKQFSSQLGNKNQAISELKSEKKKLADKIISLSNDIEIIKKEKEKSDDLYKEEREKNVDLQKQLNELKSTNQSATKEKHSRPISANKHGRTLQEKQIQNLVDEVIEEQAELEPEEVNTLEKEGEYNNPVKFKEIKHAVLKIRYQLQQNNIYDIKDISKQISMTLNEFSTFLHTNFALTEKDSILIARLIFEEDSKHHNGKILLNKEKSCLTNKIFTTLKSFINLQDKIKPYIIFKDINMENLELRVYIKIKQCEESFKETIKLDDEDLTGFTSYDSIMDALNVLELGLEDDELQFLFFKMFDPHRKEYENMHYPTLLKWLESMDKIHEKDIFNEFNENNISDSYSDIKNKPIKESEAEEEYTSNPKSKQHNESKGEDNVSLTTEEKDNITNNALSKLAIGMRNSNKTVESLFKTEKMSKKLHDSKGEKHEHFYITFKTLQNKMQSMNVILSHQEIELLMESLSNNIIQGSILLSDLSTKLSKLGIKEEIESAEEELEYDQNFDQETPEDDKGILPSNSQNINANAHAQTSEDQYEIKPNKSISELDQNEKSNQLAGEEMENEEIRQHSERIEHNSEYEEDYQEEAEILQSQPPQDKSINNEESFHKEDNQNNDYEEEYIDEPEPEIDDKNDNKSEEVIEPEEQEKSLRNIDIEPEPVKPNENLSQQNEDKQVESDQSPNQKKGKKLDFSNVKPIGVKILSDLTNYITENPESNIFEEYVFIQVIQTKKKQNSVYLINSKDFFETLEIFGIITNPIKSSQKNKIEEAKESIKDVLCLDSKYRDLLMLK